MYSVHKHIYMYTVYNVQCAMGVARIHDGDPGFSIANLMLIDFLLVLQLKLIPSESESECKCLTCNQKPTGSQFSLLHEPN